MKLMEEIDLYAEFDSDEELNNWIDSYLKFEEFIKNSPFLGQMNRSHTSWIMAMIIFKWNIIKAKSLTRIKNFSALKLYLTERLLKELFCKIDVYNSVRIKFAEAFSAVGTFLESAQFQPKSSVEFNLPIYDLYNVLYILEYRLINAACYSDIEAASMVLAFKEHLGLNVLLNFSGGRTDELLLMTKQEVNSNALGPDYFD